MTVRDGQPEWLIETKISGEDAPALKHFADFLPKKAEPILLVKDLKRELFLKGIKVKKASKWLQNLEA